MVHGVKAPIQLDGTKMHLYVQQTVVIDGDRCWTKSATYRLQADESRKSWLIRWEYMRYPPPADYAYPRAHVHLNATFADGTSADRLHVPTERIGLELVIRHLITDWGVKPRSEDWEAVLEESAVTVEDR